MKHYEEDYNECINELYQEEIFLRENKSFWKEHSGKPRTKRAGPVQSIKIKKDIHTFSLEHASKKDYASWIFPQILAYFGNKKLFFKDGTVSPKTTLESWDLNTLEYSWLHLITSSPRSTFLESSRSPALSQAVPLVLSAFKTYQNVCYEAWDFSDPSIKTFLEPLHVELLEFRNQDLPDPKTLSWNTLEKKLQSWFSFGTWEKDVLGTLPRLAKHIYTQTWLWHPTKLHHLAIQSLKNWDTPEKLLHSSTIF